MSLEDIHRKGNISVRSYNVCKNNKLTTIQKIIDYYDINKSFDKLKNCGSKSNQELIKICLQHKLHNKDNIHTNKIDNAVNLPLTRLQREIINGYILVNTKKLSVRSKNAITKYLDNNFNVRNFVDKILFNNNFILSQLKNIGATSIPELEIYINNIKEFTLKISEQKEENKLVELKNKYLLQRIFPISTIPSEILQSNSIFQLTDFLLKENILFNENQNTIIRKLLKLYRNNTELTLDAVASEYNLSRERVRQIRKDVFNKLFDRLSFIKNFNDDLFQNYGIDLSANLIEVDENIVHKINVLNKTNFSKEFISYILAIYLNDSFALIGNVEDILYQKFSLSRNRHNWKNFYIVNKELSNFNFESFANEINNRLKERIDETYYFNFKSYISKYLNDLDIRKMEQIIPVAEKIINDEFYLFLDLNDNIVFNRNTLKQVSEYAYEALESLGKPSTLSEIFKYINDKEPGITKNEDALRGSIQRIQDIIYFGKTSTYGLKKWESEVENIKGGTIRTIITEYLEIYDKPKHISQITDYVSKFREGTYQRSIMDNLKADKSNTFIFLRQGFIGLKSMINKYDIDKYQNLPVQLGKKIIALYNRNYTKQELMDHIKSVYHLDEEESSSIINNLKI